VGPEVVRTVVAIERENHPSLSWIENDDVLFYDMFDLALNDINFDLEGDYDHDRAGSETLTVAGAYVVDDDEEDQRVCRQQ